MALPGWDLVLGGHSSDRSMRPVNEARRLFQPNGSAPTAFAALRGLVRGSEGGERRRDGGDGAGEGGRGRLSGVGGETVEWLMVLGVFVIFRLWTLDFGILVKNFQVTDTPDLHQTTFLKPEATRVEIFTPDLQGFRKDFLCLGCL